MLISRWINATLLFNNQIDFSVVIIPQNLDPADMVVSGRIEELENLYANAHVLSKKSLANLI